jgi:hypothetical protein
MFFKTLPKQTRKMLFNFVLKSCIQLQRMPECSYFMESAGAMHVRMQENMQYLRFPQRLLHPNYNVFLRLVNRARDTGAHWCPHDKKLVVPREKLERQRLKMLFFSPLITTVEEAYLKNYIYREPINTLEQRFPNGGSQPGTGPRK